MINLEIGLSDDKLKKVLEEYLTDNSKDLYIENFEFNTEVNDKTFILGDSEVSIKVEKI